MFSENLYPRRRVQLQLIRRSPTELLNSRTAPRFHERAAIAFSVDEGKLGPAATIAISLSQ